MNDQNPQFTTLVDESPTPINPSTPSVDMPPESPRARRLIIGVLLLAAVGLGSWVFWRNWSLVFPSAGEPAPVDIPSVVEDTNIEPPATSDLPAEQADWKTYRNEEYGFELKYPSDILIKDLKLDRLEGLGLSFCGGEYSNSCGVKGASPHPEIYLSRFNKDGERKELYSFVFDGGKFPGDYWPWGNALDAMNCAVVSKEISGAAGRLWDCEIGLFAFWRKGNFFYAMNVSFLNEFPNLRGTFIKILNTFRFTDSTSTAAWKIYRNEEYGFELKYPSELLQEFDYYNHAVAPGLIFGLSLKSTIPHGSDPGGLIQPFTVTVTQEGENKLIKQLMEKSPDFTDPKLAIITLPSGLSGKQITRRYIYPVEERDAKESRYGLEITTLLTNQAYIYSVGLVNHLISTEEIEIYNQILSTFRFIE